MSEYEEATVSERHRKWAAEYNYLYARAVSSWALEAWVKAGEREELIPRQLSDLANLLARFEEEVTDSWFLRGLRYRATDD